MKRFSGTPHRLGIPPAHLILALVAVPGLAGLLVAAGVALLAGYRRGGTALTMDTVMALLAALLGAVLALWWLGGITLTVIAALARSWRWQGVERWAVRRAPRLMVRTVGAVLGIQLVTVTAAHAADAVTPFWSEPGASVDRSESSSAHNPTENHAGDVPAPSPSDSAVRPSDPVTHHRPPATRSVPAAQRVVDGSLTVVQGDTLWDLTAQLLGPEADDAAVSEGTADWAACNRLTLDGDLIRPGDRLRVPSALLTTPATSSHQGATP